MYTGRGLSISTRALGSDSLHTATGSTSKGAFGKAGACARTDARSDIGIGTGRKESLAAGTPSPRNSHVTDVDAPGAANASTDATVESCAAADVRDEAGKLEMHGVIVLWPLVPSLDDVAAALATGFEAIQVRPLLCRV